MASLRLPPPPLQLSPPPQPPPPDGDLAELLTTDKIEEIGALTLFLMYEKKLGAASKIAPFVALLDRQRARGQERVSSPLLWPEDERRALLAGSPVEGEIRARLEALRRQYDDGLDTLWYMASSLFDRYPYDPPTGEFSFETFLQAFCAVQASVVHLRGEGVEPSQRFAVVPLGPPVLRWTCAGRAYFTVDRGDVVLKADHAYQRGETLSAWCGPQPNSRLLINYGIVDDRNPNDRLAMTGEIDRADPLFRAKRTALGDVGLSTKQDFSLVRGEPGSRAALPASLTSWMRLAAATTEAEVAQAARHLVGKAAPGGPPASGLASNAIGDAGPALRPPVSSLLAHHLRGRLFRYPTTRAADEALEKDPRATARQRLSARLLRIEKEVLEGALSSTSKIAGCDSVGAEKFPPHVRLTDPVNEGSGACG